MPTLSPALLMSLVTLLPDAAAAVATSFVWPVIAVASAGVSCYFYMQLSRAQQDIISTKENRLVLERLHQARDKHLATQMEACKLALRDIKQELGAQRKKTHDAQKAGQAAELALREEVKRRKVAQNERPAFAEIQVRKPEERKAAEPKREAIAPTPAPVELSAEPVTNAETLALVAQLETLKREQGALWEALVAARAQAHTQKQTAVRLQRRQEDLRRIDIISRSKMELLEDKLRGMGRQYYEAISELALLKGEVAPPKPKGEPADSQTPNGDAMTPEMIDPTPDTLRPTTLMAAEGEDEDEDEDHDSADAPTILDDLDSEGEADDGIAIPADFSTPQQPQA